MGDRRKAKEGMNAKKSLRTTDSGKKKIDSVPENLKIGRHNVASLSNN